MKFKNSLSVVFISAVVLTLLFYKQGIGLNLVLFEIALVVWLLISKQLNLKSLNQIATAGGFITTSIFTVITYSIYGYIVHFLALFLFIGVLNFKEVKSLTHAFGVSLSTLFLSQDAYFQKVIATKFGGKNLGAILWKTRIFVVPVLIVFVFITLYSFSNPVFSNLVGNVGLGIENVFTRIYEDVNIGLLLTFIASLMASIFLLVRTPSKAITQMDALATQELTREPKRIKRVFKLNALKNEYKAGIFLLFVLNTILLIVNAIDIYTVWFNFQWEGQTLKQFVHEGTYLLIISILISIALVLYFFRGNLNYLKKNKLLKYVSYFWLIQNAILTLSVAVRNFWYIEYFALASKRIGVLIFLGLTLYGLYTVFKKIQQQKSIYFLFQKNAFALYLILVLTSLINWDRLMATYNFNHADHSYVHLSYLSELSDTSLVSLDQSQENLSRIENLQKNIFNTYSQDMSYIDYFQKIEQRKKTFKTKWESKSIWAWNFSEHRTYHTLFP